MRKLAAGTFGIAAAIATIAAVRLGGWAIVSVEKIPDHWAVGKPLQLSFQVRQHAVRHVEGLQPTVEAKSGSKRITGVTWELHEEGVAGYRTRLNFPSAGDWQVTINSGFGKSRTVLLPWRVVDANAPEPVALSEPERGRRLFAAKGCVSCHVHNSVDIKGDMQDFGPDLTPRRFAADYLAKFLANPSIKPPTPDGKQMPNPQLKDKDIAPLIAFINSERRLTSR